MEKGLWNTHTWEGNRKTKYIEKNELNLKDLGIHGDPKYKLLVQLKLLPTGVKERTLRKFVCSLIKAVDYEECLLIEINDDVVNVIGSDLHLMKKKVTGIMSASKFKALKEEKNKFLNLKYSNFKRLIIVEDKRVLKIDLEGKEDFYICDIEVVRGKRAYNQCARENSREKYLSEFPSSSHNNGQKMNKPISFTNPMFITEPPDTKKPGNVGEKNNYETITSVDDGYIYHHKRNTSSDRSDSIQISFMGRTGTTNQEPHFFHLQLNDKRSVDILREQIYMRTIKMYKVPRKKIDAFYLSLSLNYVDEELTSDDILQWSEKLEKVVELIVKDFKTDFLELLLNINEERVVEILAKISKHFQHRTDQPRKYTDFLDIIPLGSSLKLLIEAIENNKFRASLYYWTKQKNLIGAALVAQNVLKEKLENTSFKNEKKKYKKYLRIYEDISIQILDSCYNKDRIRTWFLLTNEIFKWKESCITIALKTKNKLFLAQEACVMVNSLSWHNYVGEDLDILNLKHGIKETFLSPSGRCRMDMFSYLIFLTAYSVLLVSTLNKTTFHWLEAVVMSYLGIFLIKECDQCCNKICKSLKQCGYNIRDPFNILDLLSITIGFVGWAFRWAAYIIPEEDRFMIAARYLLCFDFMLYMFRFLEFFYQNKVLGPILVVIRNMVRTYIHFLLILTIFWVAYSIVSESILYPEKELKADILYSVFRRGFWAMMGEYFLDEIEHFSVGSCSNLKSENSSNMSCPTVDGEYSIPILLAAYVLFVQILMFNLLVALFNNDLSTNESKRDMIWSYQKCMLCMQYSECKILLPPFLPFSFLLRGKVGNPFKSKLNEGYIALVGFERSAAQHIIDKLIKERYSKNVSREYRKDKNETLESRIEQLLELYENQRSNTSRGSAATHDTSISDYTQIDSQRINISDKIEKIESKVDKILELFEKHRQPSACSDDIKRNPQEIAGSGSESRQHSSRLQDQLTGSNEIRTDLFTDYTDEITYRT
ncbi:transient receptor potential cation channel subfamily M member 2-like isoform X2 [Biomphalaria glabrata]|uniref:Transient receptor potential cation channel subfamily M member 2-like isoform X2 n=1 Tax=Biomphalaria glabrata TaxID=6526 RepID=A0A9W3A4Q3_BIOGL|nr:transient receptor potential cation channel subfamily M member 2-like isoform X2 [Biomphalaria glabrata]